jgi:EAL domain-containing protein (putative c-di-GMP-specific phosphodiesterase class I)
MSGQMRTRRSVIELSGKGAPRVGILDSKPHIRLFLAEMFEGLGFISRECQSASQLLQDAGGPLNLVVLGLSTVDKRELAHALRSLAEVSFPGKVMLFGGRNSMALLDAHDRGNDLGLSMLPPLKTPFSHQDVCENLTGFLPLRGKPNVPVDALEALGEGWVELYYQGKIHPRSMQLNGIKAIPYLKHPGWGTIPLHRAAVDDDERQMRALYGFVLARAAREWLYFAESGLRLEIAVGLPAGFLADPCFIDLLTEYVPDRDDFSGLMVEIEDSEIFRDMALPEDFARTLRRNRVAVSLDRVGAGAENVAAMSRFPFREIKVDSAVVRNCARDQELRCICERVRGVAEEWGVLAGAAGVDSYADFEIVRDLGFDRVEGRLVAAPMPAARFLRRAFNGRTSG